MEDQADMLYDRLTEERARWRGHPVMYIRLDRLCKRALARIFRRRRKEN